MTRSRRAADGRPLRGLATLLSTLTVVGALTSCSAIGGGGGYPITAYFDKAISLYAQSQVKILGLRSGKVTKVTLLGDRVRVDLRIDDGVNLPEGVGAALIPSSLIGERYVQLFPAWTEGKPKVAAGTEIPLERTTIPVEPDETLAAVKHLLDTLDPNATGRLIKNLSDDLTGNGQNLSSALKGLAQLANTLADKDQQLVDLVENFDKLTTTLRTREQRLGSALDQFAVATTLLAEERKTIESLVKGLASVSTNGLDLISEHGARLDHDLTVLTHLLQSVNTNIDSVKILLDAGPIIVAGPKFDGQAGLLGAYDPKYHHIDLRLALSPLVADLLTTLNLPVVGDLLGGGRGGICIPIDVVCPMPPTGATAAQARAASAAVTTPSVTTPSGTTPSGTTPSGTTPSGTTPSGTVRSTPIDGIISLLGSPAADASSPSAYRPATRSALGGDASGARGIGGWVRRTARSVVEALA